MDRQGQETPSQRWILGVRGALGPRQGLPPLEWRLWRHGERILGGSRMVRPEPCTEHAFRSSAGGLQGLWSGRGTVSGRGRSPFNWPGAQEPTGTAHRQKPALAGLCDPCLPPLISLVFFTLFYNELEMFRYPCKRSPQKLKRNPGWALCCCDASISYVCWFESWLLHF